MESYSEYLDSAVFWLRRGSLALRKAVDEELRRHDLTSAQFEVLRNLWRQDGLEQRSLQDQMGVSSPTLTGVVDSLAERGLVERQLSPHDARVRQLFLTPAGRALECDVGLAMGHVQDRLLAGFSAAEVALLKDWLRRLSANMGIYGDSCD